MISIIIPTLNSEASLVSTLTALVPATVSGVIREVIIADGGSTDRTFEIAEDAGARWVSCGGPSRGAQLCAGAEEARGSWLLFVHADTELAAGWETEAHRLMSAVESGHMVPTAACFKFQLDDRGFVPRAMETAVDWRTRLLKLPYGDQGLLISRSLYDEVGGYQPVELMEDVDLIRRLGRRRLCGLKARAKTSAARYRAQGYAKQILRNQLCLALYYMNVSPKRLARLYGPRVSVTIRQT